MARIHPEQQFSAPSALATGTPLKELLGERLVTLMTQSLENVMPNFRPATFRRSALKNLDELELKERAQQIARAMAEQLKDNEQLYVFVPSSLRPFSGMSRGRC
jgi:hypothetical protein